MMKTLILLACLCITSFSTKGDDLQKEKKILIETIKANYSSWQVKYTAPEQINLSDSLTADELVSSLSVNRNKSPEINQEHIFGDFSFKICENQAVVKFQVDFQMISAFMEKRNGEWQLVCAAVIPLDL
jgi:hypothetical protein